MAYLLGKSSMENVNKYSSEIIERIASFFEMSLSQDAVPIDLLMGRLACSEVFESLERGEIADLLADTAGDLFKRVFHAAELPNQYVSDSIYYWIGESYARIFLSVGASLFRISLLLPIREMKDLFLPYHEMDPERIIELYLKREHERSVLECLKKKRGISYIKIVQQTGISKTTLFRMKNNESLNRIGLEEANKLSHVLDCPTRSFLSRVLILDK